MSELIPALDWSKVDARLLRAPRGRRSDRGRARLPAAVERHLLQRLATLQRPAFSELARELECFCRQQGLRVPARSTIYNAVARAPIPRYRWSELPTAVTAALYNLTATASGAQLQGEPSRTDIPGDQIVFYALNYGTSRAVSYAARLPWLCLQRASEKSGWRPKSRSLLSAIMAYRGL
ncbi:MAG TPA: hypothetical protein VL137_17710 [Polyangiaceae bacterium]|nr:hypothetical protein [Polyangiaceae bacterium]